MSDGCEHSEQSGPDQTSANFIHPTRPVASSWAPFLGACVELPSETRHVTLTIFIHIFMENGALQWFRRLFMGSIILVSC